MSEPQASKRVRQSVEWAAPARSSRSAHKNPTLVSGSNRNSRSMKRAPSHSPHRPANGWKSLPKYMSDSFGCRGQSPVMSSSVTPREVPAWRNEYWTDRVGIRITFGDCSTPVAWLYGDQHFVESISSSGSVEGTGYSRVGRCSVRAVPASWPLREGIGLAWAAAFVR